MTLIILLASYLPETIRANWYSKLGTYWCKVFIRALQVQLFFHEKNQKPLPKQYILISNHPSAFEDIGIRSMFNAKFLAKIGVKHTPILGSVYKADGLIFVDRDHKSSRNTALKKMSEILQTGKSIIIYPEGGCKGARIHRPFRHGAFELSIKSNVSILPIFIHYEAQQSFAQGAKQNSLNTVWDIFSASNRRANFYIYDAIDPSQFKSKQQYCEFVEQLYLGWQSRYLD